MLKERDRDSAMTTTDAEDNVSISPLNNYKGRFDGLFSLSCNPIAQIRGEALHIINHALSQYEFFIWEHVPQLLSALELEDASTDNSLMYGIPRPLSMIMKAKKRPQLINVWQKYVEPYAIYSPHLIP